MKPFIIIALLLFTTAGWQFAQEKGQPELFTSFYKIPPTMFSDIYLDLGHPEDQSFSIRGLLEELGIAFPKGASVTRGPSSSAFIMRNTRTEMAKWEKILADYLEQSREQMIHVIVEHIEVEGALYHDWMFENQMTGDAAPLRQAAQQWIKSGQADIIHTSIVTARSGQRAKVESVEQVIFPTETGVPEIPNTVDLEGKNTEAPAARAVPSAFETRNVGTTLEVDPVIGADDTTMDLNLAPELIRQNGVVDWPPGNPIPFFTISMPKFHRVKTTTQVTIKTGQYILIGTGKPMQSSTEDREHPLLLIFVRGDLSRVGPPVLKPSPIASEAE